MFWYVIASLACCGATLVSVLGLLALTSYYIYDSEKNIPSDVNDEWMKFVTAIVPLAVVFALSTLLAGWIIVSKNRKWCFVGLLVWTFLCFAGNAYIGVALCMEHNKTDIAAKDLFNSTQKTVLKHTKSSADRFVPVWLDSIQNKSKECCGIRGYRDWEELWPKVESEVPPSCCKDQKNAEKCITTLDRIPFPGVPSWFVKTDTGCIEEIRAHLRKGIHDTFIYICLITALFLVSWIVYMIQFFLQYFGKQSAPGPMATQADSAQQPQNPDDKPKGKFAGLGGMFRKLVTKKKDQQKADDAAASMEGGGDLNGQQASGIYSESSYPASQGTLQNGSQDKLGSKQGEGQLEQERNVDSVGDLAVASSSSEEIGRGKKKKHRKHKKKSDGSSPPPPVAKDDVNFALGQSASGNQVDPAAAVAVSPTGSQDEVGDKLAADAQPKDKDKKHFPGLCFKKGTCYK